MHQNHAAASFRAGGGHLRVPEKSAHVVDDLRACLESRPRRRRLVSVYRDHCVGPLPADSFQHGQQPRLLFIRTDSGSLRGASSAARPRSRPRALRAQIEKIGPLVQQRERVRHGGFRSKKSAAIAERIRGDVDDAHHQRAPAQLQRAGSETPGSDLSIEIGHVSLPALEKLGNVLTGGTLAFEDDLPSRWYRAASLLPAKLRP